MNKLYDEFGKEIKSNRRERPHKWFWSSGAKVFGTAITILVALVTLYLTELHWQKENAPNIGFVDVVRDGAPGETPLVFQTEYRSTGKTDALDLTFHSRMVGKNEERFPPPSAEITSKGKAAPGQLFQGSKHALILEMSQAMMDPSFDKDPLIIRDIIDWKDDSGRAYHYDHCLVWHRTSKEFVECP